MMQKISSFAPGAGEGIDQLSAELLDRVRRSGNLMVAGIPENLDIRAAVDSMLGVLLPVGSRCRPKNVLRMSSSGDKPGLVKICLEDSDTALSILKSAPKLRNTPYSSYSLFSDKTRRQREAEGKLRSELAIIRAQGNNAAG